MTRCASPLATTDDLRIALADHYIVDREIGAGGMATVYLAIDHKHNRPVAIKVLRAGTSDDDAVERFRNEIAVGARLQHAHLLPLYDSGEVDGRPYYVMPYFEAGTLRDRIAREGALPVGAAVRIAACIADALACAHTDGVVHRDLKPENILLRGDDGLLADFGISFSRRDARITDAGMSLGTPQYMSPEQATGSDVVDARSDIYSLGAVLFEMLTGEPPHTGSSSRAIIAKLLTEDPRPVRALRPRVPAALEDVVRCALARLAADRFTSAAAFARALRESVGGRERPAPGARLTFAVAALGAIAGSVAATMVCLMM